MKSFRPAFRILPPAQQAVWPALRALRDSGYVLYGGTALALRLGHRQSIDFDFFNDSPLNVPELIRKLPIIADAEVVQSELNTYTVSAPVDDCWIKLSFFGAIDFGRVGEPELTSDGVVLVASPDDLLATKLKVLLQRVESKDYIDIAALLESGLTLERGLAATSALFGKTFSPVDCLRALEYFEDPLLDELPLPVKRRIHTAVAAAIRSGELPLVGIASKSLSA